MDTLVDICLQITISPYTIRLIYEINSKYKIYR